MKLISRYIYGSAPALLVLATLAWGSHTIAGKLSVGEVSPMMLIFLRWAIVALLIWSINGPAMISSWPVVSKKLKWVFLMGGCGLSLFNAFFYLAAHFTSAINLGIIQSIMPAMILLGSYLLFGSVVNRFKTIGLVLTFLGCIIIATKGSMGNIILLTFNIGDLLMLLAILFYAGYSLGLKNRPSIPGLIMMGYFSIAALIMSVPLVFVETLISGFRIPTENGWYIVLYIALVPSFLSQIFFMRGVDLVGPNSAGLYANLVPIFSALMAILILDETFRFYHLIAMVIIFSGIFLFEKKKSN